MARIPPLKLFIWTSFCPDYSSGLAFAIAQDETEAREMVEKEMGYDIYVWGDLEIVPLTDKVARAVSGGG